MRYAHLLTILGLAAACGGAPTTASQRPRVPAPDSRDPVTPPSDGEAALFARANNAFAADLWAQLRETEGNAAVSPASISLALAMTWAGARGETAEQMARTLHFGEDADAYHAAAGAVLASYNDPSRDTYRLAVANRLFGQAGYAWEDAFLDIARARYRAPLEPMNFRADYEPARARINGWVAERTHDRIQDLIPSGGIGSDTRLVLANAVYFLGDWAQPFDPNATHDRTFHAPGGARAVPTMHQEGRFSLARVGDAQVLELPYAGDDLSMLVVLPDDRDGLAAVEASLTEARLAEWTEALTPQRVRVALPKFRVDPPEPLSLAETLSAMGMPVAFESGRADFTAMADPGRTGEPPLFISAVFHKAFVAVDEEGTEAAAATAVVVGIESAVVPAGTPFVADHPFLFLIRDVHSGAVLFMGRVTDPGA